MYRHLSEAKQRTDHPAIHKRLHDLVLYTRYLERYFDYSTAKGEDRQKAFEDLIKHTYRMRQTMMVHAKALYRDLAARDKSVTVPKEAAWNVPEGKNPWKSSALFTSDELDAILSAGIAKRQLLAFEPVAFSTNLVPASRLKLPDVKDGSMGLYSRGLRTYYTWVEKEPARNAAKLSPSHCRASACRSSARVRFNSGYCLGRLLRARGSRRWRMRCTFRLRSGSCGRA